MEKPMRQKRFRVPLPLWVRIRQRFEGKTGTEKTLVDEETVTENISTTGCYFLLSEKPPLGSIADMEIRVPDHCAGVQEGTLHCRGRVVRVEPQPTGARFGVACAIDCYSLSAPKLRLRG